MVTGLARRAAVAAAMVAVTFGVAPASAEVVTGQFEPAPLNADVETMWQTDPTVWALAEQSGVLFAGGSFSAVRPPGVPAGDPAEVAQPALAAFESASGEFVPTWRPFVEQGKNSGVPGKVFALNVSPDGQTLYVGGRFTHVDGYHRPNLAAFDISDPAQPKLLPSSDFYFRVNGSVGALDSVGDALYLGGSFTKVDGEPRSRVAAVDPDGLLAFAPGLSEPSTGYATSVNAITATPQRIYVGGMFGKVNGVAQVGLAVLDPATGQSVPGFVVPTIQPASKVVTSLVHDGVLYIAGRDDKTRTTNRLEGVMAMDAATGAILWGADNQRCLGDTFALLHFRGTLFTGSHAHNCSAVGGFPELKPRFYGAVLAHDPLDGRMQFFFPQVYGNKAVKGSLNNVRALATDGDQVFVGGGWLKANGTAQSSLMRFDTTGTGDAPTKSFPKPVADADGNVTVSFTSALDRDTEVLTYEVLRDGEATPVATIVQPDVPWVRRTLSVVDQAPGAPGTTVQYRVRTTDGANVVLSAKSARISVR